MKLVSRTATDWLHLPVIGGFPHMARSTCYPAWLLTLALAAAGFGTR